MCHFLPWEKYNKMKLRIFLIKLQDCSGRTECCIYNVLHQKKIPALTKWQHTPQQFCFPLKKVLKQMWEHNALYSAAYPRISLFLETTVCSPSHVAVDASRGKGTTLPKLAFQLHKSAHIWMQWPSTNTNNRSSSASFLHLSRLPNTGGFCHSPTCHSSGHATV